MRKCNVVQLMVIVAVIIFETLPYGAICNFGIAPDMGGGTYCVSYSYFSFLPFGYANFGPLLTAVLTCIIALLLLLSLILVKKDMNKIITVISGVAVLSSILPLMFGISYYSLIGLLITCSLAAVTGLGVFIWKRTE